MNRIAVKPNGPGRRLLGFAALNTNLRLVPDHGLALWNWVIAALSALSPFPPIKRKQVDLSKYDPLLSIYDLLPHNHQVYLRFQ